MNVNAAPPGTTVGASVIFCGPWPIVTVRPDIVPTAAPKTTSLRKCLPSCTRPAPTQAPTADAGRPAFHPKWRHTTAAVVKAPDVWPDGNEYDLPSGLPGRLRRTANFTPCVTTALIACALTRSAPKWLTVFLCAMSPVA